MYYILILIATLLFAFQFLFQKHFQKQCSASVTSTLAFSSLSGLLCFIIMLFISRFTLRFSAFSFAMAAIYALVSVLFYYFSIKALQTVNLSAYSVFSMLGGMLLPSVYGITVCGEPLTVAKIISVILVISAVCFTVNKGSGQTKGHLYYLLVFILNGSVGIVSKIHQSGEECVDSVSFMALQALLTCVFAFVLLLVLNRKIMLLSGSCATSVIGCALFSGIANLLILISLKKLPASVQYPMITGGVIVFSTIISVLCRERVGRRAFIAAVLAFVATIFII